MSPEDAKKWKEHVDHDGSNIKKAGSGSIRFKGQGNNLTIEEDFEDPQPIDKRGAIKLVSTRLRSNPKTVVLTEEYSLGPHQLAASPSFKFAILDKRGAPVVQGDDSVKMWSLYGPAMLDGKRIRPVKMVEAAQDVTAALSPNDKKVVDAFTDQKSMEGKTLSTDGKKLELMGMGGGVVATWRNGVVEIGDDLGSRTFDTIVRALRKATPKNLLREASVGKKADQESVTRPVKDYGRGDDNGWGGADPWPGTGKEAAEGKTAGRVAKPSATNLMLAAGSFADKAFSVKKERAPYPRKWYRELERMFGPLPAVALKYFDDAFEHHFHQLEQGRELPPPPIPSGLEKVASDPWKVTGGRQASEGASWKA
jgi:hypothetical protein